MLLHGFMVKEVGEGESEWRRVVFGVSGFLGGRLRRPACEVFYCPDDPPTVFTCGVELPQVFRWFECYFASWVDTYDPCSLERGESK